MVLLVGGLHIRYGEGQVELTFPQIVGLGPAPDQSELQGKVGDTIPQIDQFESAILAFLFPNRLQAQSLPVESQTPLQIQHIEVKVVEGKHTASLLVDMIVNYYNTKRGEKATARGETHTGTLLCISVS